MMIKNNDKMRKIEKTGCLFVYFGVHVVSFYTVIRGGGVLID